MPQGAPKQQIFTDKLLERNIGDAFTCTGMWWIPRPPSPENPKQAVYGTLTGTSEGKYQLSTVDPPDFNESHTLASLIAGKLPRLKTIWGTTTSGEFVTLFDCDNIHWSTYFTYQATTVLATNLRRWFRSIEDVTFDELRLRYKHLVAWASTSGISLVRPEDCYGAESGSLSYSFKKPFVLQTADVGDYIISLWVDRQIGLSSILTSEPSNAPNLTYTNDTFFSIKPKVGNISFDGSQELRRIIFNFLSLLMGERTFIESIEGIVGLSDRERTAFIRVFPSVHIPKIETVKQWNMLFPYQEVTGLFKTCLRKMFTKDMQTLYNQFFAELLHPSEYAEDEFMAAIRAIEVCHRRVRGGDYVAKTDYKRHARRFENLVDVLVQELKSQDVKIEDVEDFETNLNSRLTYGYQYSLKKRLMDILADQAVFLELFVNKDATGDNENAWKILKTYATKIVKTRNYYTHYDEEDEPMAITEATELKLAAMRLIVLLYMLLLHYVGIPKEAVDMAIRKHSADMYCRFGYLRPN
jgi:hypothetical protein